jgi:excisionase family DNA binding protein
MTPRLLTIGEAAEALAVSERYIRHLVYNRRIRYVKVGRLVRIPESAIIDLIRAGLVESSS